MDSETLEEMRSYHEMRIDQEKCNAGRADTTAAAEAHRQLAWLHQCRLSSLRKAESDPCFTSSPVSDEHVARIMDDLKRAFAEAAPIGNPAAQTQPRL